ncbi:MAG: YeeE/YedE family protein [Rhizobiaceae bacterium]
MKLLSALIAGVVFGVGVIMSGMADPLKVQNFFDVFGAWDVSLIFVMIGAIGVAMPGFMYLKTRDAPLFDDTFHLPTKTEIDKRLLIGSAIFGIGWGLIGFCPGPLFSAVPLLEPTALLFIPAMLVGMWAARFVPSSDGTPKSAVAPAE